jgi:Zn-dependent peptidase ImmA (M78 family)/DNA-binding XRE family transcriptional regulator
MVDSVSIGGRLQTARRAIGLTQGEVGGRMGMATSTVSAIEAGKRTVTGPELYEFARTYERPVAFFLEAEDGESSGFRYLFRAASEKALDRSAVVRLEQLEGDYRTLEDVTGAARPQPPPDYSRFNFERDQDAETLAEMERDRLGLGDAPLRDVMDVLDGTAGVRTFLVRVQNQTWSGVSVRGGRDRFCVAANSKENFYRRNWTLTHEYAHVLVHLRRDDAPQARIDVDTERPQGSAEERFANAFASAFLMPRRMVLMQLEQVISTNSGRFTEHDLVHMAMQFGISGQAMSARLVRLHALPRDFHNSYWQRHTFNSLAKRLRYEVEDTLWEEPAVLPARFRYLAMKAFDEGLISLSKLAELLREDFCELQTRLQSATATQESGAAGGV